MDSWKVQELQTAWEPREAEMAKDFNSQPWSPQCAAGFTFSVLVLLVNTEPEFVSSAISTQFTEKCPSEVSGSET